MTRIVIVGGGPGGINTAQTLAKNLSAGDNTEVVLIEKQSYYYHVVGAPRAYVDETYTKKMFVPYDNAIPKSAAKFVRIVRGVVTQISAESSQVFYHAIDANDRESPSKTSLRFDYLVLATGSSYSVPIKPNSQDFARSITEAKLREVRGHIERANSIVVVGGGSVGCEVAAEIKARHPSKTVTIIDANSRLISSSNLREKFYDKLNASLAQLGVKVILGERLTERLTGNGFERRTLQTNQGTTIEADIQLLCGGFHPVADLVQDMDPSLVTGRGAVKVNAQLQLEGVKYANIFALGDVCNHPTPKMAFIAGEQGKFLAGELIAVIRKKQPAFTNPFVGATTEMMVLPLGPSGGVSQLPMFGGVVLGDWFTKTIKSKDFFAGQTWSSIGAKVPK